MADKRISGVQHKNEVKDLMAEIVGVISNDQVDEVARVAAKRLLDATAEYCIIRYRSSGPAVSGPGGIVVPKFDA